MEGLRSASQRGRILVPGTGLYGYDYDKLNNRLIPNTDEVIIVNKIFDLYLDGNGMKKYVTILIVIMYQLRRAESGAMKLLEQY